jgi:hypothetical protein
VCVRVFMTAMPARCVVGLPDPDDVRSLQ